MEKELIYKLMALASNGKKDREKSIPYIVDKVNQALNLGVISLDMYNEAFFRKLLEWDDKK